MVAKPAQRSEVKINKLRGVSNDPPPQAYNTRAEPLKQGVLTM